MKITNISPVGALHVVALGVDIAAGETLDVPDDLAREMLRQTGNFQPASQKGDKR